MTVDTSLAPASSSTTPSPGDERALETDIVVAGAGAVGLIAAIALARAGFRVLALGPSDAVRNGRTVALLGGSVKLLEAIGVWPSLAPLSAPLAVMRIVDDTGSLFRAPPVDFKAAEIGLDSFGSNVENADLVEALTLAAQATPGLTRRTSLLAAHAVRDGHLAATTEQGECVRAQVLVAADGARSPARTAAGIGARQDAYDQTALTMILGHDAPHCDVSTEFHTRQGPFTLVPLPGRPDEPHRSSLVWAMRPQEARRRRDLDRALLAREIEARCRFLIGRVRITGPIGLFDIRRLVANRLVGPRLVLAGEAAHALPPIGAQGLNLSLRDIATLVDHLAAARAAGRDPGSAAILGAYETARLGDVALRAAGVDGLNKALLSRRRPVDMLRGAGLLVANAPMVRRTLMRHALMPQHDVPSLMR